MKIDDVEHKKHNVKKCTTPITLHEYLANEVIADAQDFGTYCINEQRRFVGGWVDAYATAFPTHMHKV